MDIDDPKSWAARAVVAYIREYPDDPEVVRFKYLLAELRRGEEGLSGFAS